VFESEARVNPFSTVAVTVPHLQLQLPRLFYLYMYTVRCGGISPSVFTAYVTVSTGLSYLTSIDTYNYNTNNNRRRLQFI
jgi:hypothetical protein